MSKLSFKSLVLKQRRTIRFAFVYLDSTGHSILSWNQPTGEKINNLHDFKKQM